ncbi:hypothetical protein GCM10023194_01400 [Planotetraspora phitsanulokensis]|uniref:SCP domain-containing protein n=1 Tax=Planotetraspora phitsanulokensis TaxID=575192 RepID=A0A8J3XL13_9ACTN|nr:CAP domain-containing protein [Planotetraspora phitsanulokensis]GII40173.1 hypothetical protein Pph01_51760 [Planotetraspora phitsanulokensis]
MKRALGAILCVGSLAACGAQTTSTPTAAPVANAQAEVSTSPTPTPSPSPSPSPTAGKNCRVFAGVPSRGSDGKVRAAGSRAGCVDKATFQVRVWKVQPGNDRLAKIGSKSVVNSKLTVALPCANGLFYTTVSDQKGHSGTSKQIRVTCPAPPPSSGSSGGSTSGGTSGGTSGSGGTSTGGSSSGGSSSGVGTAVEQEVVRLTNAERAKAGCRPLKANAKLRAAAFGHSSDMSAKNYFDHDSKDGRTFVDRIKAAGYSFSAAAENIAKGYSSAAAVVNGWMNSSGHRANILNCAYTEIGVGYAKAGGPYWTQDFGKP